MRSNVSSPEDDIGVLILDRLNHRLENTYRDITVVVSVRTSSLSFIFSHSIILSAALNSLASILGSWEVIKVKVEIGKLCHFDGIQIFTSIQPLLDIGVQLIHELVVLYVLRLVSQSSGNEIFWVKLGIHVVVPTHVNFFLTEEFWIEEQLVQLVHHDLSRRLNVPSASCVAHKWLASEGQHINEQILGQEVGQGSFEPKDSSLTHITSKEVRNVDSSYLRLCQVAHV